MDVHAAQAGCLGVFRFCHDELEYMEQARPLLRHFVTGLFRQYEIAIPSA
ncbi:hypothetical protein [Streptomyces virginiae]